MKEYLLRHGRRAIAIWRGIDFTQVNIRASAIALHLLLSLFPGVLFILSLMSLFLTKEGIEQIIEKITLFLPRESTGFVLPLIKQALNVKSVTMTSVSFLLAGYSTYRVARWLAISLMYGNLEDGVRRKIPLFAFVIILLLILVFLSVVVVARLISYGITLIDRFVHGWSIWAKFVENANHLLIVFYTFLFTMVLYGMSAGWRRWKNVIPGVILASTGISLISLAFPYYLEYLWSSINVYGVYTSVLVFIIWVYLISLLLILGNDLNHAILRAQLPKRSSVSYEQN